MEITKTYEKVMNLSASEMFANDLDGIIMDKLKSKYVGKCENSTFIKEILGITRRSMVEMTRDLLDGTGRLCIQFDAKAIVYEEGTIMVGCEIKNIEKTTSIVCMKDNLFIYIKSHPKLRPLKKGDKLIVQVSKAGYQKDQKIISIDAQMFFCPTDFIIYRIKCDNRSPPPEFQTAIKEKITTIQELEAKRDEALKNKNYKKKWDYFAELFYPYKELHAKSKECAEFNIIEFAKRVSSGKYPKENEIFLSRHPMIIKTNPVMYEISTKTILQNLTKDDNTSPLFDKQKVSGVQLIRKDIFSTIMEFLQDYYSYIKMLSDIMEQYDEDDIKKFDHIWKIYSRQKL